MTDGTPRFSRFGRSREESGVGNETGAGADATHGTGAAPVDPNASETTRDRVHVSGREYVYFTTAKGIAGR